MDDPSLRHIFLFLDDVRNPPNAAWELYRSVDDLWIRVVDLAFPSDNTEPHGGPILISLDHDMGDGQYTGYEFLKRFEAAVRGNSEFKDLDVTFMIHSQNPVGVDNMRAAIRSIYIMMRTEEIEHAPTCIYYELGSCNCGAINQ